MGGRGDGAVDESHQHVEHLGEERGRYEDILLSAAAHLRVEAHHQPLQTLHPVRHGRLVLLLVGVPVEGARADLALEHGEWIL